MIFDADVHISPRPTGGNSITIDELLRCMDKAGVEKALTWIQPPYWRYTEESNRYVYQATLDYPDRIVGFGWADPNCGLSYALDEARRCIEEYGFAGVKLNGAQNEFYIDDEKLALPIIDYVASARKVLAFHIGGDSPEHTHPFRLAKIARRYPDTTFLMVHMGGAHFHDFGNAAIEFAGQCPNITIIGSTIRSQPLLKAIKTLGAHRVCFGSDAPFELIHVEVAKYKALLDAELSKEDMDLVMAGNICRVLGVPMDTPASVIS